MTTHTMAVRMLDNAHVFVTCTCMDSQRRKWKGSTLRTPRNTGRASWKSLGDFPVGAPTSELQAAFQGHLRDVELGLVSTP